MSTDNLQKNSQILRDKTAALHNLGCKVNAYETEAMRESLAGAGCRIVDFTERADIYVVNTCTVTAIADKKSRQMLRRVRRINPDAIIVCAGCFAESAKDIREDDADILSLADIWLGNRQKNMLVPLLCEALSGETRQKKKAFLDIADKSCGYENMRIESDGGRTRAFIKIQDGCDRFCSYCRIPYVRGRSVSREPCDVMAEVDAFCALGYKEIVITGIHVSSYSYGLLPLIERLDAADGIERIRLSSLEPVVVTEEFANGISACKKVCPHFHLSLQSGCDATLKRMNRRYTKDDFVRSVEALRSVYDLPAITTDVIAGFPGETEEEFEETVGFVRSIGFAEMHIFPFSAREGTRAHDMDGKVPLRIRQTRTARLIAASDEMRDIFIREKLGKGCEVLFEDNEVLFGKECIAGYTRDYIKACVPLERAAELGIKRGDIMPGRLTGTPGAGVAEFTPIG